MNQRILAVALILTLSQPGSCGDIRGKVNRWTKTSSELPTRHGVVWLTDAPASAPPSTTLAMSQIKGRFVPTFLVVVVGQTVEMPNEDEIAHNVYSNSLAKQFNLG